MDCDLHDLDLDGYPLTWQRSKGTENAVDQERLDRTLASSLWVHRFPQAKLSNLAAPIFNHSPMLLNTDGTVTCFGRKRFNFDNRQVRLMPYVVGGLGRRLYKQFRAEITKCKAANYKNNQSF
ncbi:hypothetical protein PTKIN_Ptkin16aG0060200 [Pterospermum kingtungense]